MKRAAVNLAIAVVLLATIILILAFVDRYAAIADANRCVRDLRLLQWPKWIGCAMGAHEGLAGALIPGVTALYAAWLAWEGLQVQLFVAQQDRQRQEAQTAGDREREVTEHNERKLRIEAEAHEVAVLCITQSIHAAATALWAINQALLIQAPQRQTGVDDRVDLMCKQLDVSLQSFTIREGFRDLEINKRLSYIAIVGTLTTFVNIASRPSPDLGRIQRLQNLQDTLMRLHFFLRAFDTELAGIFARDSQTVAPKRQAAPGDSTQA
jgi:hypothetical protein